jgi:flagellar biosynthesis protein FlhB
MSGGSDKTEEPTDKRVQDARAEGQVAKSQDLNSAMVLSAAGLLLMMMGQHTVTTLMHAMRQGFESLRYFGTIDITQSAFMTLVAHTTEVFLTLVAPFTLGITVVGILTGFAQVRPLFTIKPLTPNISKLNPMMGAKKLLGMQTQLVAVTKAFVKMAVVALPCWIIINSNFSVFLNLGHMGGVASAWQAIVDKISNLVMWACIMFIIIGVADYIYARYEFIKGLRMTKQEVRDERKSQDGSAMVKGRVKKFGQDLLKKRQLSKLPTADVVITNPTHYAIALKYDPDLGPAPVVIAKGHDHFALKLKEAAKAHGVPIIENKPLARSLYSLVELDQMIPPDLFLAVAEVLAYVFKRNKGRRPKRPL